MGLHTVRYDGGMAFIGEGGSGHAVVMDASTAAGGRGRGPTPVELLLSAIGGCTGMDVISILQKMRTPASALTITIDVDRSSSHPKALRRVHLLYRIDGELPEENARRAIDLSLTKYCSVASSLAEAVELRWDLELGAS